MLLRLWSDALAWLSELDAWKKLHAIRVPTAAGLDQLLHRWQTDPDLAGVHDAAALAKLPDEERKGWRKLWRDVEELTRRASQRP